ncbi:MAG: rhomboid family intramembrane serine protease [Bacteroidota bacterium]
MYLPIGDDQVQGGHAPLFAYGFIALNFIVWFYMIALPPAQIDGFVTHYGSIPVETLAGKDLFTLVTSMFLHGGWMHILGNMLYMWIFADNIEATIGSGAFLVFYLLGGLAAHAGHIYFNPGSYVPTIGASGALSAVMGAYLVMFPRSRVKGYLLLFRVEIPAVIFLLFWFYQQSVSGYSSLTSTEINQAGGVAWWAHIGGFVFGVLAGLYFRKTYPIPSARSGFRAGRP